MWAFGILIIYLIISISIMVYGSDRNFRKGPPNISERASPLDWPMIGVIAIIWPIGIVLFMIWAFVIIGDRCLNINQFDDEP